MLALFPTIWPFRQGFSCRFCAATGYSGSLLLPLSENKGFPIPNVNRDLFQMAAGDTSVGSRPTARDTGQAGTPMAVKEEGAGEVDHFAGLFCF